MDYPNTHKEGLEKGTRYYLPDETCDTCGVNGLYHTASGVCCTCAKKEAREFRERDTTSPWCRTEALDRDMNYYLTDVPCPKAGHVGLKSLSGHCLVCIEPRRRAKENGSKTYESGMFCKKGHLAPRRTRNTSCLECFPNVKSPGVTMPPDTIISREEAKSKGLTHYRTGRKCKRGHAGFRYVRNGLCVDCPK